MICASHKILFRYLKSRSMRWTEKGACRKKRNAYRVFLRKPEGDHLEDQGIDGRQLLGV
jgi:hypothetical protein